MACSHAQPDALLLLQSGRGAAQCGNRIFRGRRAKRRICFYEADGDGMMRLAAHAPRRPFRWALKRRPKLFSAGADSTAQQQHSVGQYEAGECIATFHLLFFLLQIIRFHRLATRNTVVVLYCTAESRVEYSTAAYCTAATPRVVLLSKALWLVPSFVVWSCPGSALCGCSFGASASGKRKRGARPHQFDLILSDTGIASHAE